MPQEQGLPELTDDRAWAKAWINSPKFATLNPEDQAKIRVIAGESSIGAPPPFKQRAFETLGGIAQDVLTPANVGATGGAILGSMSGIPGAAPVLAGAGGAVGKAVDLGIEAASQQAVPPNFLGQVAAEGAFQAGAQLIPSMLGGAFKKLTMPRASGYSPQAQQTQKMFESVGIEPFPSEMQPSPMMKTAESWSARSFGGKERLTRIAGERNVAIDRYLNRILEDAALDPNGLSLVQEAITTRPGNPAGTNEIFHKVAQDLYGDVDKVMTTRLMRGRITGAGVVDPAPVLRVIKEEMADKAAANALSPTLASGTGLNIMNELTTGLSQGPITFRTAQLLRSRLLTKARDIQTIFGSEGQRIIDRLSGAMDFSMETAARKAGGSVEKAWREANEFYKTGAKTFQSKLVKAVAELQPEAIISKIKPVAQAGKVTSSIADVQALKEVILGESSRTGGLRLGLDPAVKFRNIEAWRGIGRGLIQDALTTSTKGERLIGTKFLSELNKYPNEVLEEIFDPRVYGPTFLRELRNFASVVNIAEQQQAILGKPHLSLLEFFQIGGGVTALVTGGVKIGGTLATGGTILLPGYAMARAMTTPGGLKWLTKGLETPAGLRSSSNIAARILAAAGATEIQKESPP